MTKRGFTLIELLVVISIISLLSSIVLAGVSTARAKGRDGKRYEEVHQIDLAIQLYIANNGHAPYIQNHNCSAESNGGSTYNEGCYAISNSGATDPAKFAWDKFVLDIQPYMAKVPDDPCGTNCGSGASVLGYKYVAPSNMKYMCAQTSCGLSDGQLDQSYQMYAPLETQSIKTGTATFGSFFVPPDSSAPNSGYGSH